MTDPMWRQIAESLRERIESGELGREGKPLPSELELREEYNASRNTVRDAVKWLVTRGLVVTRPGQGTFVVKKIDPLVTPLSPDLSARPGGETAAFLSEVAAQRRSPEVSVPRVEIQRATGLVASELRIDEGTTVVSRQQQRFIDSLPWSLQTSYYPMRYVERGATRIISAEDIPDGVVAYIGDELGIEQAGRRDRMLVRAPDGNEAGFFGLPDDGRVAVFELIQTGYEPSGEPLRLTVTTYPTDRNQFVMIAGKVPAERDSGGSGA
jgi:GntR family transcriptional regulator